jgi:4-amino-4-deoxy-L-arabinose transferase-like glycosyltransferase
MAFLMFFIPRRFYWRYWMTSVPILCLGVAVWWEQFRAVPRPARARGVAFLFLTLFGLVHVISLTLYRTHESPDPPAYREALAILRRSPEPIFTLDNIWAAASGKPLYPWKHIGGDVYGRDKAMRENPQEVYSIIDRSEIVVLDRETTYWTPPHVEAYLRRHYETIFQHEHPKHRRYVEILRRRAAPASR